jgi:CRISPR/Cas system-associated exonuclease Cas4 (RecB family)
MLIEHISVSRYSTFETCHQSYKYRYHLKTKSNLPNPIYFLYGKVVHKIGEHYVLDKGKTPINEITGNVLKGELLVEHNQTQPPVLPQEYLKKLPEHVRNLETITNRIGFDGELEWEFNYDLDPPNNRLIKGFIDRLIERNGKYYILDYKTTKKGKYRKTETTISEDLQLRCYAKVVQKHFNVKAEDIKAALYYLDGGNLIATKFTQEKIDSAEQELLEAHKQISEMPAENVWGNVGNHCTRCDYRDICPFYRSY